jgi:septal ring factor EnvC (AmiA/AmiB activator)
MKRRVAVAAAAALGLAGLLGAGPRGLAGPLLAQTSPPVAPTAPPAPPAAADEDAQRRQMEQLKRDAEEKRRKARELKGRETKVLKDLRTTETKLRQTRSSIQKLNRREKQLERDLDVVRVDLSRSERALMSRRDRLALRLRGMYKLGRQRELEFLLASDTFAQLFARADYLVRVARQDRVLLLGIHHEKEKITANQQRLDLTLQDVEKTAQQKQREQRQLDKLRAKKQQSVLVIQSERQAYEAAAAELERTARRIKSVLDELERRRRAEEEARRRGTAPGQPAPLQPYAGVFAGARGRLAWPVRGEVVGSFGNEKHPKFGTVTFNSGIDIAAPLGTDVRAVARGRVDFVSNDYGTYGQMLILNHGDGYYTLYAHCSAVLLARGQEVEAGQVIARVGDTGSLKGSILHFEVRQGRSALNPLEWLR